MRADRRIGIEVGCEAAKKPVSRLHRRQFKELSAKIEANEARQEACLMEESGTADGWELGVLGAGRSLVPGWLVALSPEQ